MRINFCKLEGIVHEKNMGLKCFRVLTNLGFVFILREILVFSEGNDFVAIVAKCGVFLAKLSTGSSLFFQKCGVFFIEMCGPRIGSDKV